jgi:hypothetical protein
MAPAIAWHYTIYMFDIITVSRKLFTELNSRVFWGRILTLQCYEQIQNVRILWLPGFPIILATLYSRITLIRRSTSSSVHTMITFSRWWLWFANFFSRIKTPTTNGVKCSEGCQKFKMEATRSDFDLIFAFFMSMKTQAGIMNVTT